MDDLIRLLETINSWPRAMVACMVLMIIVWLLINWFDN